MRSCSVAAITGRVVAAALLLVAASCAAVAPVPARSRPAPDTAAGPATVLTVRPIVASVDGGAWRALLLNGASDSAGSAQPAVAALAEFIVREDAGATVSIVQSNAIGLHAGDRVMLTRQSGSTGRPGLTRLL